MRTPLSPTPTRRRRIAALALLGGVVPLTTPTALLATSDPAEAAPASHHATHPAAHHSRHHTVPLQRRKDRTVLVLLNRARSHARMCGDERFAAVGPLRESKILDHVSHKYARYMANQNFFDHVGPGGRGPGQRISAAGYPWQTYGENIAAGFTSAPDVVNAWLASDEHCANLMSPYAEIGIGHGHSPTSDYGTYWVTDMATLQTGR